MSVRKDKTRIIFTLSKKQALWLQQRASELGISISALIRFFIRSSSNNFLRYLSDEDKEIIYKISKVPWFDDEVDD